MAALGEIVEEQLSEFTGLQNAPRTGENRNRSTQGK